MRAPAIRRLDFPYGYALRHMLALHRERLDIRRRQFDRAAIEERQRGALARLIEHAYQSCPYYTRLFDQIGLRREPALDLADLARIPPLTRRALQESFYDLCSGRADLRHGYIKRTSGSTGEPVRMLFDYTSNMHGHILLLNFVRPYGIRPQDFVPLRTGIMFVTGFPNSSSFTYLQPQLNLSRFYKLNIHPDQWGAPLQLLQFISARRPLIITGMPEHLLLLLRTAQAADPSSRWPIQPHLLIASGDKLSPDAAARLERAFQAPVVDIYAMSEIGYLAVACVMGAGYHVDDSLIVEIVHPDGTPAAEGELGEIVVTSLRNFALPLIRYRTGDIGRMAASACPCGSCWPLLDTIEGRVSEFLVRPDGSLLSPFVLARRLQQLPLAQYQVVQQSPLRVLVRYIADDDGTLAGRVSAAMREALGPQVQVQVEQVASIGEPGRKTQSFIAGKQESHD